jgi:hypothetical protein
LKAAAPDAAAETATAKSIRKQRRSTHTFVKAAFNKRLLRQPGAGKYVHRFALRRDFTPVCHVLNC